MIDINTKQKKILKSISHGKQVDVVEANFDLRTIKALVRRDFAKIVTNKKGKFVKITAKGKKEIN